MDPLTAALLFGAELLKLIRLSIESQPPDVRAAHAREQLARLQAWDRLLDRVASTLGGPGGAP